MTPSTSANASVGAGAPLGSAHSTASTSAPSFDLALVASREQSSTTSASETNPLGIF